MNMVKVLFSLMLSLFTIQLYAQSKATHSLFKAIEKNNLTLARNAIREGADPNGVDSMKQMTTTALIKAVELNRLEIVETLLNNHADPNVRRISDFHSALMVAAEMDLPLIADLLLNKGADVNLETLEQETALHVAAERNSVAVAQVLLKHREIDVACALAVAAEKGNTAMVLLLKKQNGARAPNPVCLEKAQLLAKKNHHEQIVSILNRN